jgi:hypothetical protein
MRRRGNRGLGRTMVAGRRRKILIGVAAAALAGGAFAVSTGVSSAGENCAGLDQALQNNLNFIAGQKANPDALSDARIANRQAVVDLINQRRATAGCTGDVQAEAPPAAESPASPGESAPAGNEAGGNGQGGKGQGGNGQGNAGQDEQDNADDPGAGDAGTGAGNGEVVCKGSTVTLSGEGGVPAASSGTFPIGTTLRVTNLDNAKSITVKVATTSGSCVLLNNAAFEEVREPGKFLIRRAIIERVG